MFNVIKSHHLQHKCYSSLFNNYKKFLQLTILLFQKVVDELLAKSANEPCTSDVDFNYNMFVVPKHIGDLLSIINPKQLNCHMYIPTFKIPTIKHIWQLIQQGDYGFSVNCKDVYLHIQLLNIIITLCTLFGRIHLMNGKLCRLS